MFAVRGFQIFYFHLYIVKITCVVGVRCYASSKSCLGQISPRTPLHNNRYRRRLRIAEQKPRVWMSMDDSELVLGYAGG